MRATCPKCGLTATVSVSLTNKGQPAFGVKYTTEVVARCSSIQARLKELGTLTGDEMMCPDLQKAAAVELNRQSR